MSEFLKDFIEYFLERRKWWLFPLIVILLLVGGLVVFSGGTAVAPFIYSMF